MKKFILFNLWIYICTIVLFTACDLVGEGEGEGDITNEESYSFILDSNTMDDDYVKMPIAGEKYSLYIETNVPKWALMIDGVAMELEKGDDNIYTMVIPEDMQGQHTLHVDMKAGGGLTEEMITDGVVYVDMNQSFTVYKPVNEKPDTTVRPYEVDLSKGRTIFLLEHEDDDVDYGSYFGLCKAYTVNEQSGQVEPLVFTTLGGETVDVILEDDIDQLDEYFIMCSMIFPEIRSVYYNDFDFTCEYELDYKHHYCTIATSSGLITYLPDNINELRSSGDSDADLGVFNASYNTFVTCYGYNLSAADRANLADDYYYQAKVEVDQRSALVDIVDREWVVASKDAIFINPDRAILGGILQAISGHPLTLNSEIKYPFANFADGRLYDYGYGKDFVDSGNSTSSRVSYVVDIWANEVKGDNSVPLKYDKSIYATRNYTLVKTSSADATTIMIQILIKSADDVTRTDTEYKNTNPLSIYSDDLTQFETKNGKSLFISNYTYELDQGELYRRPLCGWEAPTKILSGVTADRSTLYSWSANAFSIITSARPAILTEFDAAGNVIRQSEIGVDDSAISNICRIRD